MRKLVRMQHVLFAPLLAFARISWASQSFLTAVGIKNPTDWAIETTGILVHYTWMLSIPYRNGYGVLGCLLHHFIGQV